jgi:hypothetical protein
LEESTSYVGPHYTIEPKEKNSFPNRHEIEPDHRQYT